ncbi:leucine Rich repeat-containing domain protein, partial [Opisthorchis viverrini]
MTSLRLLDLRKTGLTELPDSLQHLVNLEILMLDGNPLHTPPLCVVSRGLAHVMAFLVLHSLGYRRNSFGRQTLERRARCGLCGTEDMGVKNPVRSAADSEFSSHDHRSYMSLPGLVAVGKRTLL